MDEDEVWRTECGRRKKHFGSVDAVKRSIWNFFRQRSGPTKNECFDVDFQVFKNAREKNKINLIAISC
jgi:hypothetical protein